MEVRKYDVAIVGGGASGLAAAIELGMSSPELSVLVIEKMDEPGRKLRTTGSGRCNITNIGAAGYNRIMEFFTCIGLVTREYANGLVYPYSESAADVVELLVKRSRQLGADFCCGETVTSIKHQAREARAQTENSGSSEAGDARFEIESVYKDSKGEHRVITMADFAVLACGGKAGPMYGTTGDGYRLARELGHSIVTPVPVLTGIECGEWEDSDVGDPPAITLAGTRAECEISLYMRKDASKYGAFYAAPYFYGDYPELKPVFREYGELQFTKYGLSGICVFNMTRHMKFDRSKGGSLADYFIKVNLFPGGRISDVVESSMEGKFADAPLEELMRSVFKRPLADYITGNLAEAMALCDNRHKAYNTADEIRKMPIAEIDALDVRSICELVHGLEFEPVSLRGWRDAQATSGGVSLPEIDEDTAESKKVPGLYITGELADRDFPCGGFNLSNAWISGLSAAESIIKIRH